MKVKPVGKRVLVAIPKREEKTKGGLIIAGAHTNEFQAHDILDVGDEVTKVKVGQKAYLPPYGGFNVEEGFKIVEENDVIAIVIE